MFVSYQNDHRRRAAAGFDPPNLSIDDFTSMLRMRLNFFWAEPVIRDPDLRRHRSTDLVTTLGALLTEGPEPPFFVTKSRVWVVFAIL
jgi:hypothetical protein